MGRVGRDKELLALFLEAERGGTCLVATNDSLRKSLAVRKGRGEVVRPAKGMYARLSFWSRLSEKEKALHVLRTYQLLHPEWAFCRGSANLVYGLPVSFANMKSVDVVVFPRQRYSATEGVRYHALPTDARIESVNGLRVVSFERAVFDGLRFSDFPNGLAVADAAVRSGRMGKSELFSFFRNEGARQKGRLKAEKTLLFADGRSESPGESIARAIMIEMGFALPDLQAEFAHPLDSRRRYRVDFLWMKEDGSRVIGEFDGRIKYEDAAMRGGRSAVRVLEEERIRESRLSVYGLPIMRFSYRNMMDRGRFALLLGRFGVPHRERAAEEHERLMRGRLACASMFSVVSFS